MKGAEIVPTLRSTWGEWIAGQPWDLFLTMTHDPRGGHKTHPEAMLKRFRYCSNKISDHVYGRHWDRRGLGVQWLVGVERHQSWSPHLHGLLRFPLVDIRGAEGKAIFDLAYWQKWTTATGGFCRLDLPRSNLAVVTYVSKYVVKDGELHWSDNCEFPSPQGTQLTL